MKKKKSIIGEIGAKVRDLFEAAGNTIRVAFQVFAGIVIVIGLLSLLLKSTNPGTMDVNYFRTENLPTYKPDLNHYKDKQPAIIHLELPHHNGCTAFVIDANYAITAGHCLAGTGRSNFIQNINRTLPEPLPVQTVGFNTRVDYGLLKGNFSDFNHAWIFPDRALAINTIGHNFMACGFPEGQTPLVCTGLVIIGPSNFMILALGEAYPGMSGGPVVDPVTGAVIGIVVAAASTEEHRDMVVIAPLTGFLGAFGIEP